VYEPGRGTGRKSTIGLPAGKAPESDSLSERPPDQAPFLPPKAPGSGVTKAPQSDSPTEKASEKKPTESDCDSGMFQNLLNTVTNTGGLSQAGAEIVTRYWHQEPSRTEQCMLKWCKK